MKLSEKIRRELGRISGTYSGNDAAVDEMNAILLQLTIALMMIFLIAFALFRIKTTEELAPVEKIREEQQLNFQRQELIMALERTEEYFQIRYGLKTFTKVGEDEQIVRDISQLISDGKLVGDQIMRDAYINGSRASFDDYSRMDDLLSMWRTRTLLEAGIDETTMQAGNGGWLNEQIRLKIEQVRNDVLALQHQGAELIQRHLAENPGEVGDLGIKSLLEQYIASPPVTRKILLNELDSALRGYAFNRLKQLTGAPLLREVDNE